MIDYTSIIEKELICYLKNADLEPLLRDSMAYSLMNAGKRIRPILCLAVCEMLNGKIEKALPFACSLEMIHTYSLIHDDLPAMDNDSMRRGQPSSHIAFGEANAILAGDGLLSLAGSILSEQSNLLASKAVMTGAIEMLNGQMMDINDLAKDNTSLIRMYEGKTGGLFCAGILAGFYAAGGKENESSDWKKFGLELGRLFQITDDILDKEKDFAEHKFTYLSLHSLEETMECCDSLAASLIAKLTPYSNEAADFIIEMIKQLPKRTK